MLPPPIPDPRSSLKPAKNRAIISFSLGESPSWLRHWILIPACEGSNPSSPAKILKAPAVHAAGAFSLCSMHILALWKSCADRVCRASSKRPTHRAFRKSPLFNRKPLDESPRSAGPPSCCSSRLDAAERIASPGICRVSARYRPGNSLAGAQRYGRRDRCYRFTKQWQFFYLSFTIRTEMELRLILVLFLCCQPVHGLSVPATASLVLRHFPA